jgi:uncharacterized protein (DUF2267 family)
MEYNEFVKHVQETAELDSPEEALAAIQATLGTLGEMLSKTERDHLAAQLHKPLKECLYRWIERPGGPTRPHRFSLEEFYNRVSARSNVGYPAAVRHSLAVMSVLQQAVSQGEMDDILRELPNGYEELLTGKPQGPVSPTIV